MDSLPIVLVPGLMTSPRLYREQIPELWRFGPVTIADHTRDADMASIAQRILSTAPPQFALAGLSMGGYISLEIMRQAPERVLKLALLDTSPLPDTPESATARRAQIELTERGRFDEIPAQMFPRLVHPSRRNDETLLSLVRQMAAECGPEAFIRQQRANIKRPDSRPTLASIRCPTLVLVGAQDELTPPERSREMSRAIRGSRLVIVPDSGHASAVEQPRAVTDALLEWLRSEDARLTAASRA